MSMTGSEHAFLKIGERRFIVTGKNSEQIVSAIYNGWYCKEGNAAK